MNHLILCDKHYNNLPTEIRTSDETKCDFCRKELLERMEKFGYYDFQEDIRKARARNYK